ncbi:MAG: serine--tRNA ligase, partial [Rikenellaceae bacterium]
TLKVIRDDKQFVVDRLKVKGVDASEILDKVIALDDSRKCVQGKVDALNAELNNIAKEVGILFKSGKKEEAEVLKNRNSTIKEEVRSLEEEMAASENELTKLLITLPNMPSVLVPEGRSDKDNVVVKDAYFEVKLPADALPHWELARKYDIIDWELGTKLAGAGFPVYKRMGARLQRALIAYFLDRNIGAGYDEMMPPIVANEASGYGTGQLPDKEGQMYHATLDNLYLIPTAEVPVTNIYRDVVVEEKDLPIKMTAYTPCFRREAGSYGKDVRGLNRLHQFDKVEIVQIVKPEGSYGVLDSMVAHVESIVKELELPYRILRLCGGDISFTSALTYDFEVYSAA